MALRALVWKTFDVNLTWIMIFHLLKVEHFCFYTVYMDPIVKKTDFWVIYTSQNVFYFFFKKLDVVTITRYQITFWIFDFSLLEILPKYMNPKIVLRTLYALDDLPKIADGRTRTGAYGRTYGHRFLNVCHTRAPKGAIIFILEVMNNHNFKRIQASK